MSRRPSRGMTIVETLVMLGLLGIFGSIAYPILTRTMQGIRRNQQYAVQFERGRDALRALGTQLRQAAALPNQTGPTLSGSDGGSGPAAQDRLVLTAADLGHLPRGSVFTVEYLVGPAGLVKRLQAPDGTAHDQLVAQGVIGLDCAFLADGRWAEEWAAETLPDAVRLIVWVTRAPGAPATAMFTEVNVRGEGRGNA